MKNSRTKINKLVHELCILLTYIVKFEPFAKKILWQTVKKQLVFHQGLHHHHLQLSSRTEVPHNLSHDK